MEQPNYATIKFKRYHLIYFYLDLLQINFIFEKKLKHECN